MPLKSLSARLLVLTVFFVMVGEVLIFVPSVARYRMTYFENHLAAGYIATLALDASPTGQLDQSLTDKLLAQVGAQGVGLHRADGIGAAARPRRAAAPRCHIDLTQPNVLLGIRARSARCSATATASCGCSAPPEPTTRIPPRCCSTRRRCATRCGISASASSNCRWSCR